MHHARKILVQQSLYISDNFQVALLDGDGAPRKLLSLSATERFLRTVVAGAPSSRYCGFSVKPSGVVFYSMCGILLLGEKPPNE
jgi:hypothetical protein